MKVRVVKTPSFAAGGIYDGGYQLSPGEAQAMIMGYGNAFKNVAGAVGNFANAVSPIALGNTNKQLQKTLGFESAPSAQASTSSSSGLGSLTSALGSASQISSLLGGAGSAAGATGAAAGAAGAAGGAAGLAGLASSLAPLAALASDKRVKENIERVGETYDGQNIYRFNYKGDPHTQLGLIAQEVEKTGNADSVYNVNGIKMVDYNSATEDAAEKGKFMNSRNSRKRLSKTMTYEEGGKTNPQLLLAYRTIANELANGQDPNSLVDQFVDSGMNYDDAQNIVAEVIDFMDPTSEAEMPQAQMGGGMNAGMFAGQSMGSGMFDKQEEPHIIPKPFMKDGGTFVTSQNAYTQKSHNYFGTSNAPTRDSYVDNNEITTSVKAVPREDATIEAEKGEYIFNPQGLYKILGKKHYEGGTPLAAKGGEFIFSAHRDMSIDPELQKEANLKTGSSKALAENTPAKILERNVDVKEYNRLKTIANDPKHDAITKKTALFMLEKMDGKIQIIAKLQEAKKQPNPVEIKDQVLEQPEIQQDVNAQKQFAHGGFNLPAYPDGGPAATGTIFSGQESDVNSQKSKDQALQYEIALRKEGYEGPSMLNLDYSTTHPEIKQAQEFAVTHFGPQIASYLRTQKPSNAVKAILNGKDIKDVSDEDLLKAYPDSYWSWRGFVPTANKPEETPHDTSIDVKKEEKEKDLDLGNKPLTPGLPGTDNFRIKNPYDQVRAMQASQYLGNVIANKPYFTRPAPVVSPLLEAQKMSYQPFLDEAAKSRYSANQLASKFGDPTQKMIGAAQQNDAINKGMFEIGKFNAAAETENRNQNLLRDAARTNTWNDRVKQAEDQNMNVLDKMNFANAAYYNQYSTGRQKDLLNQYYNLRKEKMDLLSSVEGKQRIRNGKVYNDLVFPLNERGELSPEWSGWNTNLVNSMTDNKTSGLSSLQKELDETNLSDEQKNEIIANYFTRSYGGGKTKK